MRDRPRLVSVVIPALDVEHHIAEQLDALTLQTYEGDWEVVIVDNGCRDQTLVVTRSFATRLPALRIVDARDRRGLNHARNVGAREARGDFLAYCDGDDRVVPGWLDALVDAATGADIVGGPLVLDEVNDTAALAWHPPARRDGLPQGHWEFLPYASGGNCGIWTDVARELGWDERFTLGGADYEFCWRAQLAGHRLAYAPGAVLHRRFRSTLLQVARQHYRYGRSDALLVRTFGPHGLQRRSVTAGLREWGWLVVDVPVAVRRRNVRGRWMRRAGLAAGRLAGSVRERTLAL